VSHLPSQRVSELLVRWKAGDQQSLEALLPLVYKEVCAVAHTHLQRERPGHTLQTTALVHEAYLRLVDQRPFQAEDRTHFLAVAARLMRQILVDYARSHRAAKRGTNRRAELEVTLPVPRIPHADAVEVDEALKALARIDEQQSRFVELRFFGGLTTEETADPLAFPVLPPSVNGKWPRPG
jgi:RNA polymerase sigma factor (TIGR02999 family)